VGLVLPARKKVPSTATVVSRDAVGLRHRRRRQVEVDGAEALVLEGEADRLRGDSMYRAEGVARAASKWSSISEPPRRIRTAPGRRCSRVLPHPPRQHARRRRRLRRLAAADSSDSSGRADGLATPAGHGPAAARAQGDPDHPPTQTARFLTMSSLLRPTGSRPRWNWRCASRSRSGPGACRSSSSRWSGAPGSPARRAGRIPLERCVAHECRRVWGRPAP